MKSQWLNQFPRQFDLERAGQTMQQQGQAAYLGGQIDLRAAYELMKVVEHGIEVDRARTNLNTDATGSHDPVSARRYQAGLDAHRDFTFVLGELQQPRALYREQAMSMARTPAAAVPIAAQLMFAQGGIGPDRQANLFGTFARAAAQSDQWFALAYYAEGVRALAAVEHIAGSYNQAALRWQGFGSALPRSQLADHAIPLLSEAILVRTDEKIGFLNRLAHALGEGNQTAEQRAIEGLASALTTKMEQLANAGARSNDERLTLISALAGFNQIADNTVRDGVAQKAIANKVIERAGFGVTVADRFERLELLGRDTSVVADQIPRALAAYKGDDAETALAILSGVKASFERLARGTRGNVGLAYGPFLQQLQATIELIRERPHPDPLEGLPRPAAGSDPGPSRFVPQWMRNVLG
jgi:hypothetical protein